MRSALWGLGLIGLLLGGTAACLVELEHTVRCGDGYVDSLAGEECDPADPSSYEHACQERGFPIGNARCEPETCQIQISAEICAFCGDGVISPGEQCDSAALGNHRCPSGEDLVTCDFETCRLNFEACPHCGNGVFEPEEGEECEWNIDPDLEDEVLGKLVACEELESLGAINKPYSQGQVSSSACTKTCQFSRKECSFCGDDDVDDSYLDLGKEGQLVLQGAEVCDGQKADSTNLAKHCKEVCNGSSLTLRCDFECQDECARLESPPEPEANCCIQGGESCIPYDDIESGTPCCYAVDNPEEGKGNGCQHVVVDTEDGQIVLFRCRAD